jgi:DNA-binding transcriptional ArsR family regulator
MSTVIRKRKLAPERINAKIFAALGDETRLTLVKKLSSAEPRSIAQLALDSHLTRQAITKHLRVLEDVGIVHSEKTGRESLFELNREPIDGVKQYLESVAAQWQDALGRLKAFVEK